MATSTHMQECGPSDFGRDCLEKRRGCLGRAQRDKAHFISFTPLLQESIEAFRAFIPVVHGIDTRANTRSSSSSALPVT